MPDTPHARPTSIRIFLVDGVPEGIRIIDKSNWTGRAVVTSRTQLPEALAREEFDRPGVYVLLGPGDGGASRIYIGEADVLRTRLKDHATKKDFWTRVVAFSSSDGYLNKAHIRYLEARLVRLAREANQWEVENDISPSDPPLSAADRADADWFLAEMLVIYPILGIDAFEIASDDAAAASEEDEFRLRARGADGRGREVKDGFVVLKESRARASETESIHQYLSDQRTQLLQRKVMVPNGKHLVFTQDFRFSSPSTAAGVLVGGAANGRKEWKHAVDGRSLREVQDEQAMGAG